MENNDTEDTTSDSVGSGAADTGTPDMKAALLPPKTPGSAKSSGKKKLTKAEKEKLKKEEEERKRQEEEEAKLRAEREEQERLEREKAEAEETRRLENEERKRRKGQLEELEAIWDANRAALRAEADDRRKKAKWDRYMKCDGSPDPTVQGEINTFINLWREDVIEKDVHTILKGAQLTLGLIAEVEFLIDDTPPEEMTEKDLFRFKQTMDELQVLLQEKIDLGSHDLLLKATELADSETMNLQKVIENPQITLCMWGNLSKNPRIKFFEFEERGFTFDLPKILTLSDCAFRLLFTQFDHYSQHCKSFYPRKKVKVEELPPPEEVKEEGEGEVKDGEEGEKKEGEGEEGAEAADGEKPELEKEKTEDVLAGLEGLDGKTEEEKAEEETEKEAEPMEEDYEIRTPEPTDWEDFDGDDEVLDLRAYHIMGGIFHFDLLNLPPQPKNVRNWVMTLVEEPPRLTRMDYVVDDGSGITPAPQSAQSKREEDGDEKKERREEKPPIGVTMKLPSTVYFCEEPQVVRWDSQGKQWSLEGFSQHNFDEDKKIMSFKTSKFGVMALAQDAHINMPFQSWEIRPRAANHALLTVIAAIVEVEIEIKDGECCLLIPEDKPELEHFRDQWMPPHEIIKKLRLAGINVFPAEDSHKYVSIQNKNAITEERLYQQMALTASCMAYSWSKWNNEIKADDKIVIQGVEHLVDEPLLEEDWALYLITKKRTTKLKMTEFDENFSEDHAEGTEFHADLYHMTNEISTDDGRDRIKQTSHHFINAVYTMLKGIRVVTYS